MPDVNFAVPGDPATLTGGYVYARRLMEVLPGAGWQPHLLRWPDTFPTPRADDLAQVRDSLVQLPARASILIDGLAFGALPTTLFENLDLVVTALVHHPLALENGLSASVARALAESERTALRFAKQIIVTSPTTAQTLRESYDVPADCLHIALPGTDSAPRATGSEVPLILSVGTFTPRKGHDVLVDALARVADLPWTCTMVGSLDRDPTMTAWVKEKIAAHGLKDRIHMAGEMSARDLQRQYAQANVFALASRYEGYGMVFAEALAHGLPIVACRAGAVPETVPADAGLLTPPDDDTAFSQALRRVLTDNRLRGALSDAAWRHGQELPSWDDTARTVAQALTIAREDEI